MKFFGMRFFLLGLFVLISISHEAHAQISNTKEMVEISAGETLEWNQKAKQYTARGSVEVKQGDVIIASDVLVADYKEESKNKGVEIYKITATGNVVIKDLDTTAVGDKAIYNVDNGLAVLTGGALSITTSTQKITARDKIEYNTLSGQAKAIGNATINQGNDTLSAQTITADFVKDAQGKQSLKRATAVGGVTIKTPTETLTGNSGIYNAQDNTVEIKGQVKIVRGPNVLEGDRAEVNLVTNVSKIYGSAETGKRVKAIFFPGSEKR
jgi:lipopolysaccharide export system protein LptA